MQGVIGRIRARLSKAASSGTAKTADDPAAQIAYVLTDPVEEVKPRSLITFTRLLDPTRTSGEVRYRAYQGRREPHTLP